jgi:hypothetical protein
VLGNFAVRQAAQDLELVDPRGKGLLHLIGRGGPEAVAVQLKPIPVVVLQNGLGKVADRVVTQIG